jgi:hypothetical protein
VLVDILNARVRTLLILELLCYTALVKLSFVYCILSPYTCFEFEGKSASILVC